MPEYMRGRYEHLPTLAVAEQFNPIKGWIPEGVTEVSDGLNEWVLDTPAKGPQAIVKGDYVVTLSDPSLPANMRRWVASKEVFERSYRLLQYLHPAPEPEKVDQGEDAKA